MTFRHGGGGEDDICVEKNVCASVRLDLCLLIVLKCQLDCQLDHV